MLIDHIDEIMKRVDILQKNWIDCPECESIIDIDDDQFLYDTCGTRCGGGIIYLITLVHALKTRLIDEENFKTKYKKHS